MASLTAADFRNSVTSGASNPSAYGYHHGPIPNNNPNWVPDRIQAALDVGQKRPDITTNDNADPPNAAVAMSSMNTGVCGIVINGVECGQTFLSQPAFRRHTRMFHPGALINTTRSPTTVQEETAGQTAMKRYVVTGAWRTAVFVREPGCGPINGKLNEYADACERIAVSDAAFRQEFGSRFHREVMPDRRSTTRREVYP